MTTTRQQACPRDARAAAELYMGLKLKPIPVQFRTKVPTDPATDTPMEKWTALKVGVDTLDRYFPPGKALNIAVLNGKPSGNLLDVDIDSQEALRAAPLLLPTTGWIFGRNSSPRSHWIYRTDLDFQKAQAKHTDVDGTDLLELRGSGGITVYPPSTHKETGERIEWDSFTTPATVRLADLARAVQELAAATILARHWPEKGSRHDARVALAGGLLRAGWDEDRTQRFLEGVAAAAENTPGNDCHGAVSTTARKLADGENVHGWPFLESKLGTEGPAVVRLVRDWLGIATVSATAAEVPVPVARPWPHPMGAEAFHGLAGRIVNTILPASEADPAALLAQAVVAFGNVIGRSAHFLTESDRHHANEFVVIVGRTSKARKGTSWGRIIGLYREANAEWASDRVQSGLSSGEGLIWAVRDAIMKRERIKEGKEVRYDEVEADPGIRDKRLLVIEPEFANVLKQTERQGNTVSAVLRLAWDGLDLRTLTKNTPARATEAHVGLIGHITAQELLRYLAQTEAANGYGNRHLWICAERSKALPEGGLVDAKAMEQLRTELVAAIAFGRSAGAMVRDNGARAIWRDVYEDLSNGKPGLAGALVARAEAHVMRLAMIYALMDQSAVIGAKHLLAAIAFWDYAERSVHYVFGDSLGDPIADEILQLLRTCPKGLTRNDLREFFQRNQSSDRIGRALGLLLQEHLVRREQEQTAGRPAERWFAVSRQPAK